MSKFSFVWICILCCGFVLGVLSNSLYAGLLTDEDIERRANEQSDNEISKGWINFINDKEIVIDDTSYKLYRGTKYNDKRYVFKEGVFVGFLVDDQYRVLEIGILIPGEEDMDMKPIDRSRKKSGSSGKKSSENSPKSESDDVIHIKDGVWQN